MMNLTFRSDCGLPRGLQNALGGSVLADEMVQPMSGGDQEVNEVKKIMEATETKETKETKE